VIGAPRLVLHPGHPKCGSSSIQHALFSNIESLRERGVIIPARRPNRVFMQACLRQDFADLEKWLNDILAQTRRAGGDTVVISAENLGVRRMVTEGRPIHEKLFKCFRAVDVIYYVRRQDDWMVSQWQQWGHKLGLDLESFIENQLEDHEPNYLTAAAAFEDIYGGEQVSVVPLHMRALLDGDLIADFCRRSGIGSLPVGDEDRRKNASMDGFLCDVLARVPHVHDQALTARVSEGITDQSVRRLLERSVRSGELLFSGDKRIMSVTQRRRVLQHFAQDNHELHEQFFADVPFDLVFGQPEDDEDPLKAMSDRVDGLTDVVAIQMDLILKLLEEADGSRWRHRLRRRARSLAKRISRR
jgi:hypothetical protein